MLTRLMSSKFPLVVIMTDLAERLKQWELDMNLDWIPRNQNEEASGFTNGNVESFAADREVKIDLKEMGLHTLDRMWNVADELYKDVQKNKALNQVREASDTRLAGPKPRPLRERDPW